MSIERRYANLGHNHDDEYLSLAGGTLTGDLWISNAQPNLWFKETDATSTTGVWRLVASGNDFYGQLWDQAIANGSTWLTVTGTGAGGPTSLSFTAYSTTEFNSDYLDYKGRATTAYLRLFYSSSTLAGYVAGNSSGIGFLATDGNWSLNVSPSKNVSMYNGLYMNGTNWIWPTNGGLRWDYPSLGRTYSAAATMLGNNVYVNASDAVSGQVRTATTHGSYGHTIYELYAGTHYWYGNTGSVTADAVVTKNPLAYLTAAGSFQVYGEFRVNGTAVAMDSGGFYVNTTAGRSVRDTAGTYGTVSVYGSKNSYSGVRFDASFHTANLMFATGSDLWGVYTESGTRWDLLYNAGELYTDGQARLIPHALLSGWGTSARFTRGTAAPSGGTDGDIYFRTSPIGIYLNLSGTWTLIAS